MDLHASPAATCPRFDLTGARDDADAVASATTRRERTAQRRVSPLDPAGRSAALVSLGCSLAVLDPVLGLSSLPRLTRRDTAH